MSLDETHKFLDLVERAYLVRDGIAVYCHSASEARALRRKFYRIRENLPSFNKKRADSIIFKLSGRSLIALLRPDWTQNLGVLNATNQESEPPPGHRLDDQI